MGFLFTQLDCFFSCADNFWFCETPLVKYCLDCQSNDILFRKSFPTLISSRVSYVFLQQFQYFRFLTQVFDNLELVFVQGNRHGSNFILLIVDVENAMAFSKMVIFILVILLVHEHRMTSNRIMMDNLFDACLYPVQKYFIQYFLKYSHQRYWLVFFYCYIFAQFYIIVIL